MTKSRVEIHATGFEWARLRDTLEFYGNDKMTEGVLQRVNVNRCKDEELENGEREAIKRPPPDDQEDVDKMRSKRSKLTLMEELLLLSFRDGSGNMPLFNDTLSMSIRACILIELAIRGKVEMEPSGARKRTSDRRSVLVVNTSLIGEPLLDEALRIISESEESDTVAGWISLLSGETWNPFRLKYQMRNVRDRLAKCLVEKGVCTTAKQNYLLFDLTTHPVIDASAKKNLIRYIQSLLVHDWRGPEALSPRDLALICVSHITDAIDQALIPLSDTDYELAWNRVKLLANLEPEKEIAKLNRAPGDDNSSTMPMQVVWASLCALYDM